MQVVMIIVIVLPDAAAALKYIFLTSHNTYVVAVRSDSVGDKVAQGSMVRLL